MKKINILGFNIIDSSMNELLDDIFNNYNTSNNFIVNINPEIIMNTYQDKQKIEIFNKQRYQIPDGSGIVWASKKIGGRIKERITGIDLMNNICERSQSYSSRIFLYGSKNGVAEKARNELKLSYPRINIIGVSDGYAEEKETLNKILELKPDILFVGLGSPKQEDFIINNMEKLKCIKIIMPVGGSFDVISKNKRRAPKFFIKFNLEWFYRLLREPKRFFRQIKLVKFIILVLKNRERKK